MSSTNILSAKLKTFFLNTLWILTSVIGCGTSSIASEIHLNNGDRIHGQLIEISSWSAKIDHEDMGLLEMPLKAVRLISHQSLSGPIQSARVKGRLQWVKDLSLGYEIMTEGKIETQTFFFDALVNRNRLWKDEWTFKASGLQEYSDGGNSIQRGLSSIRYAYSFRKKYYNFYRFEAQHDFFENLKSRLIPSLGIGWWISDKMQTKLLYETGFGYQIDTFRSNEHKSNAVIHLRQFFSHQLNNRIKLGVDVYYFPNADRFKDYRTESEGSLNIILTKRLTYKIMIIDRYQSQPNQNVPKNSIRLVTSMKFSF